MEIASRGIGSLVNLLVLDDLCSLYGLRVRCKTSNMLYPAILGNVILREYVLLVI